MSNDDTHHAPPGGHAVGRGAGRSGDYQAVRLDGGEVLLVAVALQVGQVRARTYREARQRRGWRVRKEQATG